YLVAGATPAPDWSRRLLDAHAEGWLAVGSAVAPASRREGRLLAPWSPAGRNPRFERPLLFPSLLEGVLPAELHCLPAFSGEGGLFEGRAVVRLRPRSGRPRA